MSIRTVALCLIVMLSGCAELHKMRDSLYTDYAVTPLQLSPDDGALTLIKALMTTTVGESPLLTQKCLATPIDPKLNAECSAQRNTSISVLMVASEQLCVAHRKTIYGNEASANIAFGTFTNLFAGAAAVVTHTQTQALLSALALFSNSERSLVNETVYKTILVAAVDKKIQEIRDVKAQAIYTGMGNTVNDYPVVYAIRDIVVFHNSCSFMTGLQKALDEGTQGTAAQKVLRLREALRGVEAEIQRSCTKTGTAGTTGTTGTTGATTSTGSGTSAGNGAVGGDDNQPAANGSSASNAEPSTCSRLKDRASAINEALKKAETDLGS